MQISPGAPKYMYRCQMNKKEPNLQPTQETIDFISKLLPNYESCPNISRLLQSRTEGFFDKTKYPVDK